MRPTRLQNRADTGTAFSGLLRPVFCRRPKRNNHHQQLKDNRGSNVRPTFSADGHVLGYPANMSTRFSNPPTSPRLINETSIPGAGMCDPISICPKAARHTVFADPAASRLSAATETIISPLPYRQQLRSSAADFVYRCALTLSLRSAPPLPITFRPWLKDLIKPCSFKNSGVIVVPS